MLILEDALKAVSPQVESPGANPILQLPEGAEGFEDFGDLLGAFGGLFAEEGGEGFGVEAVDREEFLEGGDLGGDGFGPGGGSAGAGDLGEEVLAGRSISSCSLAVGFGWAAAGAW